MPSSDIYKLDELEKDLETLNTKIVRMKQLEWAIEQYWALTAVGAVAGYGTLGALIERAEENIASGGDLAFLEGNLPERCRALVGIDPLPFEQAQTTIESSSAAMLELAYNPGQILNNIAGNWYGRAAEAFEDYFASYEVTQAIQAELYTTTANACASIFAVLIAANASVKRLVRGAIALAEDIIAKYKDTMEALGVAVAVTVLAVLAGGLGFIAATGAVAAASAVASGTSALLGGDELNGETFRHASAY